MVCLFSYGSSLVSQSTDFPSLRSSMNAKNQKHHLVPADGIECSYKVTREIGSSEHSNLAKRSKFHLRV